MFPLIQTAYASSHITTAQGLVDKINTNILFPLIALMMALAFVIFLWGAFEYVKNSNNESARETGRNHLMYGVIGMLIMLSAFAILNIAAGTFGIDVQRTAVENTRTPFVSGGPATRPAIRPTRAPSAVTDPGSPLTEVPRSVVDEIPTTLEEDSADVIPSTLPGCTTVIVAGVCIGTSGIDPYGLGSYDEPIPGVFIPADLLPPPTVEPAAYLYALNDMIDNGMSYDNAVIIAGVYTDTLVSNAVATEGMDRLVKLGLLSDDVRNQILSDRINEPASMLVPTQRDIFARLKEELDVDDVGNYAESISQMGLEPDATFFKFMDSLVENEFLSEDLGTQIVELAWWGDYNQSKQQIISDGMTESAADELLVRIVDTDIFVNARAEKDAYELWKNGVISEGAFRTIQDARADALYRNSGSSRNPKYRF